MLNIKVMSSGTYRGFFGKLILILLLPYRDKILLKSLDIFSVSKKTCPIIVDLFEMNMKCLKGGIILLTFPSFSIPLSPFYLYFSLCKCIFFFSSAVEVVRHRDATGVRGKGTFQNFLVSQKRVKNFTIQFILF